ncbi:MAG: RHS repeat-associated core domain-containing protein, partial [Myxococcota bacterium]
PYRTAAIDLDTQGQVNLGDIPARTIAYNGFKQPVTVQVGDGEQNAFHYNALGERLYRDFGYVPVGGYSARRYYSFDGRIEATETLAGVTFDFYLGGDAYDAPLMRRNTQGAPAETLYLHRDHLSSIVAISDSTGSFVEHRHFDAWGVRDALTDGDGVPLAQTLSDRGYTGHEHLHGLGLIHMNGRLYDPVLHQFLAPDNYIQDLYNTQNFNRYAYVLNNPLAYNDPSGEVFVAVAIGAGIAAASYTLTALLADVPFSVEGLVRETLLGGLSAAATWGIGQAVEGIRQFGTRIVAQALAHASYQGVVAGVQGGDVLQAVASASLASLASSLWSGGALENGQVWG